eukprot:GFYU01001671.1.p1 GENE.GFYU01001671.1~~GFYU01001671.1.p1  ORF type:complete len:797 (-),score=86.73 GFYU01001671.1:938-3328(-)
MQGPTEVDTLQAHNHSHPYHRLNVDGDGPAGDMTHEDPRQTRGCTGTTCTHTADTYETSSLINTTQQRQHTSNHRCNASDDDNGDGRGAIESIHSSTSASMAVTSNEVRERVSVFTLVKIAAASFGECVCWAVQFTFVTVLANVYGVSASMVAFIHFAGPFCGIIVQLLVGVASDNAQRWWCLPSGTGKRRPYVALSGVMLCMGVLMILSSVYLHRIELPAAFPIGVAIVGTWIMDVGANVLEGPARAMLIDMTPPQQHEQGNAIFVILNSVANIVSGFVGYTLDEGTLTTNISWLLCGAAVIVVVSTCVTLSVVEPRAGQGRQSRDLDSSAESCTRCGSQLCITSDHHSVHAAECLHDGTHHTREGTHRTHRPSVNVNGASGGGCGGGNCNDDDDDDHDDDDSKYTVVYRLGSGTAPSLPTPPSPQAQAHAQPHAHVQSQSQAHVQAHVQAQPVDGCECRRHSGSDSGECQPCGVDGGVARSERYIGSSHVAHRNCGESTSSLRVSERATTYNPMRSSPVGLHDTILQAYHVIRSMPAGAYRICTLYVLTWLSYLPFLIYIPMWFGGSVYCGDAGADTSSSEYQRYVDGVRVGSAALAISATCCLAMSLGLSHVARHVGTRRMLPAGHAMLAIAYCTMFTQSSSSHCHRYLHDEGAPSPISGTLAPNFMMAGLAGAGYAIVITFPYVIMAAYSSKDHHGIYMGLLNVCNIVGVLLGEGLSSATLVVLGTDNLDCVLVLGGIGSGVAMLLAVWWVHYPASTSTSADSQIHEVYPDEEHLPLHQQRVSSAVSDGLHT